MGSHKKMMRSYILKNRKPILCNDHKASAMFSSKHSRRIRSTFLNSGLMVSTVFLVFDHSWENDKVELFETMIFTPSAEADLSVFLNYQTRCATHRGALKMHWFAVNLARSGIVLD